MLAIAVTCCNIRASYLKLCALFNALGSVIAAVSMGPFHGMEYIESHKVKEGYYLAHIKNDPAFQMLMDNMSSFYGYSYIVSWVGVGCGLVACIVFLCLAMVIKA